MGFSIAYRCQGAALVGLVVAASGACATGTEMIGAQGSTGAGAGTTSTTTTSSSAGTSTSSSTGGTGGAGGSPTSQCVPPHPMPCQVVILCSCLDGTKQEGGCPNDFTCPQACCMHGGAK